VFKVKHHHKRVALAEADYEDRYAEALRILREKYDSVGLPYRKNGERVCDVETLKADDLTVFMLAWGHEIAHQIVGSEPMDTGQPLHRHSNAHTRDAANPV
jgi:hypothetical protein